jgi:hypothetical protein
MSDEVRSWDLVGGVITDATYKHIEVHLKDGRYVTIEPEIECDDTDGEMSWPSLMLSFTRCV